MKNRSQRIVGIVVLIVALTMATTSSVYATLVSAWRAEGNTLDSAGGNHGILQGGLTFTPGVVGQAFRFNGTDAGISVLNNATLNFLGGDLSITTWVRFTTNFPAGNILFLNYGGLQTYFLSLNITEQPNLYFRDGGANFVSTTGTTVLNDGNWHHLAAVRSGTTGSVYVDGVLQNSVTNPAVGVVDVSPATYARIGWAATGPTNAQLNATADARFAGDIDELLIFNHALSAADIEAAATVPEPTSMALLAGGLVLMVSRHRAKGRRMKG